MHLPSAPPHVDLDCVRGPWLILRTLQSDNCDGNGNGNVRGLGRAWVHRVGVPAKIEITNFTN